MGTLRFADLQTRATAVLDLTSLTVDEFQQLVPPFAAAFQAHMAEWRLDGRPRTARRYTTYTNCPLPTP
jgi:Helix-turn-helix of DDE superfamily endonuclease